MRPNDTAPFVARVLGATTLGIEAIPVEIEVHVRSGLPSYTVVGLPQASVRESRDRVLSALRTGDFPIPRGAVTVSLAPADVRKNGSLFDLPLAVAMLVAQGVVPRGGRTAKMLVVGELALDGRIRPVRGALSVAIAARACGAAGVLLPAENAPEAAAVAGIEVHGVASLREAVEVLKGLSDGTCRASEGSEIRREPVPDLSDVRGQAIARRAMEVAAAGGHNLLMSGPPGSGKTMLARRFPGILPVLDEDESLEVSRIHSVAGLLEPGAGLISIPPFRSPHHTITTAGLVGGGDPPRPGEVTLAHRGVLFLDELPEFRRGLLETLRQPLEDGHLVLSRARWSVRWPARFQLIGSMNACPCGRLGSRFSSCLCSAVQLARYRARLSGPLMDRIDMHVAVGPVSETEWRGRPAESTADIAGRVQEARGRLRARFGAASPSASGMDWNLRASPTGGTAALTDDAERMLSRALTRLGLSARAVTRVGRVARTIADLEGSARVNEAHIAEAIQYRALDRPAAVF